MNRKLLYLFIIVLGIFAYPETGFAQSNPQAAGQAYKKAKDLYNNGNATPSQLAQAQSEIGRAINLFGTKPPSEWNKLRTSINNAITKKEQAAEIARQQALSRAEKQERENNFNEYISQARTALTNKNYEDAQSLLDNALELFPTRNEGLQLQKNILSLKNRDQASIFVKEGEKLEAAQQYRDAFNKYKEAQAIDPQIISDSKVNSLSSRITNFDTFMRRATTSFENKEYSATLESLEKASGYMALDQKALDLRKQSNYFLNKLKADNLFTRKDYLEAEAAYKTALIYAYTPQIQQETDQKIIESRIEQQLKLAGTSYAGSNWNEALGYVRAAEVIGNISASGKTLKENILQKIESTDWEKASGTNSIESYLAYLRDHPNTQNAGTAKSKLGTLYEADGDAQLKKHGYENASTAYENAKLFNQNNSTELDKKIKKTEKWQAAGIKGFTAEIPIPLGYSSTAITTRDLHSIRYTLSPSGVVNDNGFAHQKVSESSVFTPIGLSVTYNLPLRTPGIRPLNFFVKGFFSSMAGSNLDELETIDYTIYKDVYPATTPPRPITRIDTLYKQTNNAYKISRAGINIGFQPVPYFVVYIPIQKVTINYQPGLSCLECNENEIKAGKFGSGLGFEARLPLGKTFSAAAFWENWNGIFNSNAVNNTLLFSDDSGGKGLFTPSPFSRIWGFNVGVKTGERSHLLLKYENPLIRGEFTSTASTNYAVRSFSQHILNLAFKIKIN